MPCRYTINPEARVVSAEYYGTLELADVRKNQSEMRADPGFDPSFNYLVDLRGVQTCLTSAPLGHIEGFS